MQKNNGNNEPPLSLSQQAYVLASSLREIINGLAITLAVGIVYYALDVPVLLFIILYAPFWIFMLIKTWRFYLELNRWNEQYLQNSYILIFDTTIPKGNSTGEKILNLAKLIFPQLRSDYINYYYVLNFFRFFFAKIFTKPWDKILLSSLNYRINQEYYVDVAFKTLEGYFIVKDFKDKVITIEDLNYLINVVSHKFGKGHLRPNIFRIIVVARNYDQYFFNRESLEQIMKKELKSKLDIDLIVEEQTGYSVLWIS